MDPGKIGRIGDFRRITTKEPSVKENKPRKASRNYGAVNRFRNNLSRKVEQLLTAASYWFLSRKMDLGIDPAFFLLEIII